jgi:hypothetical protein
MSDRICADPVEYGGFSNMHVQRLRNGVDMDQPRLFRNAPASVRFWAKVNKTGDCWLWTAGLDKDGYGRFRVSPTRLAKAHRFAYEVSVGPIPDGLEIDHLCFVRSCVRPQHLEAVTHDENLARGDHSTRFGQDPG